jgi:RNA recognition motif-containing protein
LKPSSSFDSYLLDLEAFKRSRQHRPYHRFVIYFHVVAMADYTAPGAAGAAPAGTNMNGSTDSTFAAGAPLPSSNEAAKTLWMGEMEGWMDENFVKNIFSTVIGENVQVKVIRDRNSGNAGYCFIEFNTPEAANKALALTGTPVPNSTRVFKLNWASGGGLVDRRDDRGPEYSIFVGDLGPEVNEFVLVSLFQSRFPSCKSAKIMTDAMTGQSRGYGFVRFSEESDQQRALVEMQGVYCGNRPMRISTATPKTRSHQYGHGQGAANPMAPPVAGHAAPMGWGMPPQYFNQGPFNPMQPMNQFTDPNNTTVFVGGLSGYVTEDELRSFFQGFGEITYVKIPPGKGCGFVQFVHRHAAEMAINQMQGYPIGNSRVRLSWGRSQNNSGVGTPYRPAPPPPHYMAAQVGGMPPHAAAPAGPYAPQHFPGNGPQGPPGAMQ